jgi:hypothetical protein
VTSLTEAQLRRQNDELRKLVFDLAAMIVRTVAERRALLRTALERRPELANVADLKLRKNISPSELVTQLHDTGMRCAHLSHTVSDPGMAREFESFGAELADLAQRLEAVLADPEASQEGHTPQA